MIRRTMMVAGSLALGACSGSKAPAPDTSAGAAPAPAAAVPAVDSMKVDSVRVDTLKPATDTSTKRVVPAKKPAVSEPGAFKAIPPKPDSVGFDIAIKPKYKVDEKTGKITPIKRP